MWSRPMAALLVACSLVPLAGAPQSVGTSGSPFADGVAEEPSPAPDRSGQPRLHVDRQGRVRLSWIEQQSGSTRRFRMSERQGSRWTAPVTIVESDALLANWADVPSIFVTSRGTIAAHWLALGTARGAYAIRVTTSVDGGTTWTPMATPHQDDSASEHGFASFFETPGDGLGLAWLDGRLIAERGRDGSMALRATMITDGAPGEDVAVDLRACDCCPTAAARTDRGVIVAYRDRTAEEVRDIAVTRLVDGRWSNPITVADDGWQINACPVNGPAIDAAGRTVAVAWFTMAGGRARTMVAFSADGGETFGPPVDLRAEATRGRVALALLGPDRALVTSVEKGAAGLAIVAREVRRDGRLSDAVAIAPVPADRTFPRMVVSGRRVWFAWTDLQPDAASKVRVASVRTR